MNILIILHNPKGHTGLIGEKLVARGYTLTTICHLCGDPLPAIGEFDAVIVFGGKMSVNDCETTCTPLKSEIQWIYDSVAAGVPYLGICLGGQLLARAFGGSVTRHNEQYVEIGYYNLYPTIDGFTDPAFANTPEKIFQWHNEGFTTPDCAVKLAASDLYPNQAFKIGDAAYGLQFHPEATLEQILHWHERDPEELAGPGAQTVPTQLADYKTYTPAISQWLDQFLDCWLAAAKPS